MEKATVIIEIIAYTKKSLVDIKYWIAFTTYRVSYILLIQVIFALLLKHCGFWASADVTPMHMI